jgi:hypothetical protein
MSYFLIFPVGAKIYGFISCFILAVRQQEALLSLAATTAQATKSVGMLSPPTRTPCHAARMPTYLAWRPELI